MSKNRYKSVFRFIKFDDTETRQNRISATKNKYEAIVSTFDQFSVTCTENCSSCCNLTADEGYATHRGRSAFVVYVKSKPEL